MKNTCTSFLGLAIILTIGLGCGLVDKVQKEVTGSENANTTNGNKTLPDKPADVTLAEEKIGVPECDELFDALTAQANSPDDNYITKTGKAYFFNTIREKIRRSVEENKGDKVQMAKECKEIKKELDKQQAADEANK